MSTRQTRYDEDFKRTLVDLCHNGKTQSALCKEYGVSLTALPRCIKQKLILNIFSLTFCLLLLDFKPLYLFYPFFLQYTIFI